MPAAELVFSDQTESRFPVDAFVARVPAGLGSRESLFAELQLALRLPCYFGANWDALEECLNDLSWVEEHAVYLMHEGLPELPLRSLCTYLDILGDAARNWRGSADHSLVVVFPAAARSRIEALPLRQVEDPLGSGDA